MASLRMLGESLRIEMLQTPVQHVGKEMVVTIPMPVLIQRNDEQVHQLQGFQQFLSIDFFSITRIDDRVTQQRAHAV